MVTEVASTSLQLGEQVLSLVEACIANGLKGTDQMLKMLEGMNRDVRG
jgi:hypothetical protein